MPAKQAITIKSQDDRIDIMLDGEIDFETLSENLRKKVSDAKQFFEGATTNIAFRGRDLSESEKESLLNIITTETTMQITLVEAEDLPPPMPRVVNKPPAKVLKAVPVSPSNISYVQNNTAYYHGGLRSGQSIKFGGSVVVLGDVNPGSEVVAEGNVIILGSLKGMAHAGVLGDASCFVCALALQPTQLRIANLITYVPALPKGKKEPTKASIAYVKDGQVFIGPL
jgi:septum site-determining protein MinC